MFSALGRFTAAHPWLVCLAWLAAGTLLTLLAPRWDTRTQDDDVRFLPARCDSVRGYQVLGQAFPDDVYASRVVFAIERPDGPLRDSDLELVSTMVADLNQLRSEIPSLQIGKVYSYRDPLFGKRLLSADGRCTLIQVALGTPYLALQTQNAVDFAETRLRRRLETAGPDAPRLLVTGSAGIGRDLVHASASSLDRTTLATILLVVGVLFLVYRSPLLALVPLATIAVSVWVALQFLALCTLIPGVYLVNVSKVFAIVLLYGAGTDYCLFLLSRYREEVAAGMKLSAAVTRSVKTVGGALAASAGTVICGLSLMGTAEFAKVRCAGPAIGVSLAVTLAASLTLTPALLHLLGKRVFWPRGLPQTPTGSGRQRGWDWISRQVTARPGLVWALSLALLVPLAVLGFQVRPNYRATGELSPQAASIVGLDVLQQHFTAGEVGPVTVLLRSSKPWDSRQGRDLVDWLSRGFAGLENVAEVRSLTQPVGKPLRMRGGFKPITEYYTGELSSDDGLGRYVTRLDVVLRSDPFAPESQRTLELLQFWLREELPGMAGRMGSVRTECYGVTVGARDMAQVTEADRLRVNCLVLLGIFVILLVLVRRGWLAGYLLLTVLVSYFAALGATALAGMLWNGRLLFEVDWRVPFFLFTILVAVGEDYNILLITRVLQERRRYGVIEGTRRALAATGGTITSCGLIMAGTFATLMLARLGTLVQIGFALAVGVLLDTFVVRPFLVPAFTLLVWRWRKRWRRKPDFVEALRRRRAA